MLSETSRMMLQEQLESHVSAWVFPNPDDQPHSRAHVSRLFRKDDDQDEIEDDREDDPSQTGRGAGAAVQPTNARPPAMLDPREAPG
jgi:hypothetical protein